MAYTQLDNGLDLNFDVDPEERKRRLAMLSGLYGGGEIKDLASNLIDQRLQPVQQLVEEPQQYMNQRLGMPQQFQQPQQQVMAPAVPQMPDETQAETQRLLQQNQQATPMAPAVPNQPSIAEQTIAAGAPQAQQVAPVSPDQMTQQAQQVEMPPMPQFGEGVQVAGPAVVPPAPGTKVNPAFTPTVERQTEPLTLQQQQQQTIIDAHNNPDAQVRMQQYAKILGDPNSDAGAKALAGRLIAEDYNKQKLQNKAEEKINNASETELARYLSNRDKSEEGSYVKAILFARLGLTELANKEQQKINPTFAMGSEVGSDGQRYSVFRDKQGAISKAFDINGKEASSQKLAELSATSSPGLKLNVVGGTYINDKTGEVGRVVTDEKTGTSYIQTDNGRKPMTGFRPQSSTGSLDMQRVQQVQKQNIDLAGDWAKLQMKIQGAAPEAANKYLGEFNAKHNTRYPLSSISGPAPQISFETGQMTTAPEQVAPTQVAPTQVAPRPAPSAQVAPRPAAGGGNIVASKAPGGQVILQPVKPGDSPADVEAQAEIKKKIAQEIVKPAAEQIAVSADTQNMLNSITKVQEVLESGKHNVGSVGSAIVGRGPIAQAFGEQFETTDAKNTKLILDTVNKLAADGLKILGANPSTADLQFWTQNKPNGSTDPEVMKEWIASRASDIKRRLGYAEKQVETGGTAGAAPQVYPEKTINGVTYIYDGKGWKQK